MRCIDNQVHARLLNFSIACLLGGAIGDALGYAIEFNNEQQIQSKYGFVKTFVSTPLISDDTQMTLYTAVNLLSARTRGTTRGVGGDPQQPKLTKLAVHDLAVFDCLRNWHL